MTRFVACLAVLGSAAAAHAGGVEVGGTVGIHVFSEDDKLGMVPPPSSTSLSNSALFGIRLGAFFTENIGIEAEGGLIPAEPRMVQLFDVYTLAIRAQVVYQFRAQTSFVPFVGVGAGVLDNVYSKDTDVVKKELVVAPQVGAGIKYYAAGNWGVRADARLLLPPKVGSGITTDFEVLLSLFKQFGGDAHVKVDTTPEVKKDVDSDGDGIPDSKDKCPKEPEDKDGFQDEDGCPDPDNDGDGIPDAQDKCPGEAEDKDGFQDDDGCPDPDNDGDGIPDAADKCPDKAETRNGFQDDDGCPDELPDPVKGLLAPLAGVTFKPNTADFAAGTTAALDKVAAVLAAPELKNVKLEVSGHTDDKALPKGSKIADLQALSQARAEAVRAYLAKKGVDEARLTAKGYGETAPLQDPKDLKGANLNAARAKNARIELKLIVPEAPASPTSTQPPAPAPAPAPASAPAPAPDAAPAKP